MPALMTHDFFGQDLYAEMQGELPFAANAADAAAIAASPIAGLVGPTRDEREAFLLGNQGPDPLFFVVLAPWMLRFARIGHHMHDEKPTELLSALRRSADVLPAADQPIARAYLAGFACHYVLDSTMHPFVFAQQFAICDAGVPGLTRKDGSEVHAVIEGEFDEVLLSVRTGQTVATYDPKRMTLRGSSRTLSVVSKMYCYAVLVTLGVSIPPSLFAEGVRSYRRATGAFRSRTGTKRSFLGAAERLVRPHSFYQAMSWRAVPVAESAFENRERRLWENPFTGVSQRASFADLFVEAKDAARKAIALALDPTFDEQAAREITRGLNFSGKPVE